jgi:dihydrofolate reductase
MQQLMVDFIITLDGYASGEGWPGFWGLEGPEYLAWLDEDGKQEYTVLMGANTYRLMHEFAEMAASESDALRDEEVSSLDFLTAVPKVVFSSTLSSPVSWANTTLERGDAVEVVRHMKEKGSSPLRTLGSISLCRSLLQAGLVDRFRVVVFPLITGKTGSERIYDGYPDVMLDLVETRTFDGRLQLLDFVPTVIAGPPGTQSGS